MKQKQLLEGMSACLISLGMVGSANAALLSRLDGQAYYDDQADLTWLADAKHALTSGYTGAGVLSDGRMTWQAATDWAAQITVGGVGGWRLANTNPINGTAYNYDSSTDGSTDISFNISRSGTAYAGSRGHELANLFYNVLGNVSNYDSNGVLDNSCGASSCLTNTGPFGNVQHAQFSNTRSFSSYWSATEFTLDTSGAFIFSIHAGIPDVVNKDDFFYAWAVQSGDVGSLTSAVPVPAAVWLFGSGLLGLISVARRLGS